MAFKGMNPDEGRQVAGEITEAGSQMLELIEQCTSVVSAVEWIGPDYDAFVEEWNAFVSGSVTGLVDMCSSRADELTRHADQQDSTSNAG